MMVSVIIPIYNTQDYLEECIKSVVNEKYFQFLMGADGLCLGFFLVLNSFV